MNIVTFEQSKKLDELGFGEYTPSAYSAIKDVGMASEIPFGTFFYMGEYSIGKGNQVEETHTFDTHPEAESALLDELLIYLTDKK